MSRARRSDGDVTKSKILQAAGALFAENGFAQTTNKAIAQAAEVDLAAINYHFDGRDGLYKAVLAEAHSHYIDEQYLLELVNSSMAPALKLQCFYEALIHKLINEKTWHSHLFLREFLSANAQLSDFIQNDGMRKFLSIRTIISQASGIDENSPALLPCILSVMAPCFMLILSQTNVQTPLQLVAKMDTHVLVQHLMTFSMAGLQAIKQQQG